MKKNLIPFRNLIIIILVIISTLFFSELSLFIKSKKTNEYNKISDENQNIILLQTERCFDDGFFMSATNVYNANLIYDKLEPKPILKSGYPLIDDLTNETKLKDALNIVVIGDSFVWGAYSTNRNELFWRVLENDFRKKGISVNVFGVGTTGANAYEELSWLTDYTLIEDLDPDLVIFGYVYNDPDDSVKINGSTVNWDEELPVISKSKILFPHIYQKLIENISVKTMYTDKYSNSEYISYDGAPPILKGRFYEKYKTDFAEKLDKFASTVDFPIAVVTLPPVPNNKILKALYEPLEEIYSSLNNINYYNSIESFKNFASAKHKKNYTVNAADFHPGSATNKFFSDYIRNFIEKDYHHLIVEFSDRNLETNNIVINEYLPYRISLTKIYEDTNSVAYNFEYPNINEVYNMHGIDISSYYLTNPLGKNHVKLSFSSPINIDEIKISGEYTDMEIFYTRTNKKLGYDDHSIHNFEFLKENTYTVKSTEDITAILITADFDKTNNNRKISITFNKNLKSEDVK